MKENMETTGRFQLRMRLDLLKSFIPSFRRFD